EAPQPLRGRARRRLGFVEQGVQGRERAAEAGGREVLALAVVVGDAGRREADGLGDLGDARAAEAAGVEERRGGVEDLLTLALVTRRLSQAGRRSPRRSRP